MKITTIIVTYNNEKTIRSCLESLLSSTLETEIIVIDNNSLDKTLDIVSSFPKVKKVIKSPTNVGFGTANNLAAKEASGRYLFFLNPDATINSDTIKILSDYLDSNPEVAVIGPKLLNIDGSFQRELSTFPSFLDQALVLLRLHRLGVFQKIVYPSYDYEKTQEAEHIMGAALMMKRDIFERLGGFDEKFFLWFEETDLLRRVKESEMKIVYYPETSVTHLVGSSTKQISILRRQTIWNKSLLYYFFKRKNMLTLLLLIPFVIISYPLAELRSLLRLVKI